MGMQADEPGHVLTQLAADRIRFVRLQFTDIQGRLKNVSLPVSLCRKAFRDGIWFDGSSIGGFARIEESDMFLMPDPATYCIIPWSPSRSREARFICNVMDSQGKPFGGDPRFVLMKTVERTRKTGFEFFTGPEMEFWLFGRPSDTSGIRLHDNGGYFDLFPADNGVEIRRDIVLALSRMGFTVEASHHEVSGSQHEISLRYGPALATADRIVTFKYVARTIALQHGVMASFLAKPRKGINGNAMHIHASLFRNGKNAFTRSDGSGGISETAIKFIGGLLAHAKGLCRLANSTINSYKRLTPGYEAPCIISWSTVNRSALVRVPAAKGDATRIEFRSPDAMGNPYLLLAGMLAAGMDGIQREIIPPESTGGTMYNLPRSRNREVPGYQLPGDLAKAHECLLADRLLCNTLGRHIVDGLTRITEMECEAFRTAVHPWEIQQYFQKA